MPIRPRESSVEHGKRRRSDQRWLNAILAETMQAKAEELMRLASIAVAVTTDPALRAGYCQWLNNVLPFPVLQIPRKKKKGGR